MSNNPRWLETAEYVCVVASVVGSVAAVFSHQIAYACIPLSCSLVLNIISRSAQNAASKRTTTGAINRVNRQLGDQLEALKLEMQALLAPYPPGAIGIPPAGETGVLAQIQRRLAELEAMDHALIGQDISHLAQEYATLHESIANVIDYLNRSSLVGRVERLEQAMSDLSNRVEAFVTRKVSQLEQQLQARQETWDGGQGLGEGEEYQPSKPDQVPPTKPQASSVVLPTFGKEPPPQIWKCVHTLPAHSDWVRAIAISPDGLTLATGSFDTSIKLWQMPSGELSNILAEHQRGVFAIAFTPDGQTLASASWDKTIKLWQVSTGAVNATLSGHGGSVRCLAISPDGQTLASGSFDETIKLWQVGNGSLRATLTDYAGPVYSMAISPNGETLATGGGDGSITLWQLDTGALIHTLMGSLDVVEALAISPNSQTLIGGNGDGSIDLWQLHEGELHNTLAGHLGPVTAVAISPDGQTFASSSADGTVKIWHLATLKLLATLRQEAGAVMSVVFATDSQTLISGSADGSVKIWQRE